MANPLRVGLVGCGAIAQIMHIPHLTEYDEYFKLVAISDVYQPVLDAVGDRYGVMHRYTDWRGLLARHDLDAVVLCHSGSHHDTTIAALDAGKHVFVEKPLAWNVRETEDVARRAAQSDRIVQLGYHKLYDPGYLYAKEQVRQMRDVGFARISVLHPANELGFSPYRLRRGNGVIVEGHVDVGTWDVQVRDQAQSFAGGEVGPLVDEVLGARKDDERLRLGYGIIMTSLIHQVYTMFGFLGEPTRVVSTEIWRKGSSIHSVVEYPGDLRVTLDWHLLLNLKDYREEYAFNGNYDRVALTFPSPYFRNFPSPVTVQGGDGELAWEKRVVVSHEEAFRNELIAFYNNIQANTRPVSSVEDAVKHARFIQQMIDAAQ